jgi:hypothetical protein
MYVRCCLALLLAVFGLVALVGCSGKTDTINPVINWTYSTPAAGALQLPYVYSEDAILIDGSGTVTSGESNPITSYQWTQSGARLGVFTTPLSPTTTWKAPLVAAGEAPVPVTLYFTVKTLLGGEAVQPINLIIVPRGWTPS